jgi:DNA/RNA-binding domain of Phe-tRNA-synthetase-like protein
VSLASGLPISVVDAALLALPLRIAVPEAGAAYVFNRSGQTIDVAGLPSLCDAEGPCANAVKDSQRTKTSPATTAVLAIVWGTTGPDPSHTPATAQRLHDTFARLGARVERIAP